MRINKYIASCGVASRRKAEEIILAKRVKVNGKTVEELSFNIDENNDVVEIDGQRIGLNEESVYIVLNKPEGYITTVKDQFDRPSVLDLVSDIKERVYPIGRLDYETSGLLILTNDGDLTYKLTHPKFGIQKKYIVKIEGPIKESELAVLRAGVVIDGVRFAKCKVEVQSFENNISKLSVILTEGKNREIRRMFEAINHEVIFLKRVEFAGIRLGGLKRGEMRPLKPFEVEYLKSII